MVPAAIQAPIMIPTQSMMRIAGRALRIDSTMPRSMSFQEYPRKAPDRAGQQSGNDEKHLGLDLVNAVPHPQQKGHQDEREERDGEGGRGLAGRGVRRVDRSATDEKGHACLRRW